MFDLDINIILAFFFGALVIYLLARLLYLPMRLFFRLLINTLAGGLLLLLFNSIGVYWGLQIGLNVVTALIVGLMGLPGVILLLILQHITV